jgi:hypothetical protein
MVHLFRLEETPVPRLERVGAVAVRLPSGGPAHITSVLAVPSPSPADGAAALWVATDGTAPAQVAAGGLLQLLAWAPGATAALVPIPAVAAQLAAGVWQDGSAPQGGADAAAPCAGHAS